MAQADCLYNPTYSSVESGTEAGISVVIAAVNIILKLFVQFLAAEEKQWTRSEMVLEACFQTMSTGFSKPKMNSSRRASTALVSSNLAACSGCVGGHTPLNDPYLTRLGIF